MTKEPKLVRRGGFCNKVRAGFPVGLIYVLPAVVIVGFLAAYPVFRTFQLSFSEIEFPLFSLRFVGLRQYVRFFQDPLCGIVLQNSFIWLAGSVSLQFVLALGAALLMNKAFAGRTAARLIILLPWGISAVVSATAWKWMYYVSYGVINWIPYYLGLGKWEFVWLGRRETALVAIIVANSWRIYPFSALIFLAALEAIPLKIYDAAEIDGAGWWDMFTSITFPYLKPVISVILILLTIGALNSFIYVFMMTYGGPANSTQIFGMYIYQTAFEDLQFGYASAIAVILLAIMFVSTGVYLWLLRRGKESLI